MEHLTAVIDEAHIGPYMNMYFSKITHWKLPHFIAFTVVVTLSVEGLALVFPVLLRSVKKVPYNPKLHLDRLGTWDKIYIFINKVSIVTFTYHMFQLLTTQDSVKWKIEEASFLNVFGVIPVLYLIFDFFYAIFHRVLHMRFIYGRIHKHHHKQISPTRGHYDAINVHPVEFVIGEYMHLISLWLVPTHIFAVLIFVTLNLVMTLSNHARFDVKVLSIFDAKDHMVHHRLPDSNFGQYTMFWDKLFGWHRSWDESMGKVA